MIAKPYARLSEEALQASVTLAPSPDPVSPEQNSFHCVFNSVIGSVALSVIVPSVTVTVAVYRPDCVGPGVQRNWRAAQGPAVPSDCFPLKQAPAGRFVAAYVSVPLSGSVPFT